MTTKFEKYCIAIDQAIKEYKNAGKENHNSFQEYKLKTASKILDDFVACAEEDGGYVPPYLFHTATNKYKNLYCKIQELETELNNEEIEQFVKQVAERLENWENCTPMLYSGLPSWLIYKKEIALANIKNGPCYAEFLPEEFRTVEFLKANNNQDEFFEYVPVEVRAELYPNYDGCFDINTEYIESEW